MNSNNFCNIKIKKLRNNLKIKQQNMIKKLFKLKKKMRNLQLKQK